MASARTNDFILTADMEHDAGLIYSLANGGEMAINLHPNDSGYEKWPGYGSMP